MKNCQIWYFKPMQKGHMLNAIFIKDLVHGSIGFFYYNQSHKRGPCLSRTKFQGGDGHDDSRSNPNLSLKVTQGLEVRHSNGLCSTNVEMFYTSLTKAYMVCASQLKWRGFGFS